MIDLSALSKSFVIVALALLVSAFVPHQVSAELRVFELQHRPAGELAEIVRQLIGEDARIAVHRNTLAVNASSAELDELAALVASYDRAQQMLRVTVEQGNLNDDRNREFSTSGRLHSGSVTVGLKDPNRGVGGGSIFVTSGRDRVKVHGQDERLREERQVNQFMTVMEGYPASISIGKAVPFTSQLYTYWRRHPRYVAAVEYQNVDTGFEVLPEVFGESVQLEIRPFMAFLDTQNPKQIVFHELTTKVQIPFGRWYDLGGQMGTKDGLSREILSGGSSATASNNSIRVRIDREN